MKHKIIILIFLIISTLTILGQDSPNYDSLKVLCEGPIFTLCEKMPHLKNGTSAFEDSLKQYLKNNNEFPKPGKISLSLAILRSGEVKYVIVKESTIKKTDFIIKSIKSLPIQWAPGIQNGYIVCCYRTIELEFLQDQVTIIITGRQ